MKITIFRSLLCTTLLAAATSATGVPAALANEAEASGRLDEPTRVALTSALEDERNAKAFYDAVMDRHGDVAPFRNIANAEARHALAIERIFERNGAAVPDVTVAAAYPVPDSVSEACQAAAAAERENAALYDGLLESVRDEDIRRTFERLRSASLDHHLPAFEHCAAGGKDFARFAPGTCDGGCGMGKAACGCGAKAPVKEPQRKAGGCGCAARRAAQQAAAQKAAE